MSRQRFITKPRRRTLSACAFSDSVAAFTLLELMIAMVILGLGLVMVATVFPVAWTRAKELNEVTARQVITPTIESMLNMLVPVADTKLSRAGLAGDLIYLDACTPGWIASYADTRVHALNLQNVQVDPRGFVPENPWLREQMPDVDALIVTPMQGVELFEGCSGFLDERGAGNAAAIRDNIALPFSLSSYFSPRIAFGQRVYPPLPPRDPDTLDEFDQFAEDDPVWDGRLDTRRFAWAVFHRLRRPVGPPFSARSAAYGPSTPYRREAEEAAAAAGRERRFDIYFVTLRRPSPTDRYALQEYEGANVLPDPFVLTAAPVATPAARPPAEDVLFPVAWRVQIEVPQFPDTPLAADSTGAPAEVLVPPNNFPGNEEASIMLVQMFPPGAFFIDEINGQVYKVTQRRIVDDAGALAVLTLDREITLEDLEIPLVDGACDPRFPTPNQCNALDPANPTADPEELLRTVWVFPPAAEQRESDNIYPTFNGPPPVVGIEVKTMTFRP